MSQSIPAPENTRHYPGLDGLRAIAVLMVFVQHYLVFPDAYRWGWTGVQVFFVLSGFLITGILYDTRDASNRYRAFYARRALRIFPLYFGVLAAGWALWPIFHWELHKAWLLAPLYLSNYSRFLWLADYVNGHGLEHLRAVPHPPHWFWLFYGHLWSLSVEEQFYLVWPFVVFNVRSRKRLLRVCAGAVIFVPLLRLLCTLAMPENLLRAEFVNRVTPLQLDSLLLGAALALHIRGEKGSLKGVAYAVLSACGAGVLVFEFAYFRLEHHAYVADWTSPAFACCGLSVINFASAALLLLAMDRATFWSRLLSLPRMQWLGKISYGFYVFHDIPHVAYLVLGILLVKLLPGHVSDPHNFAPGAIALFGTLLLAALSFRYFEAPFLRLKSRFVAQQ